MNKFATEIYTKLLQKSVKKTGKKRHKSAKNYCKILENIVAKNCIYIVTITSYGKKDWFLLNHSDVS